MKRTFTAKENIEKEDDDEEITVIDYRINTYLFKKTKQKKIELNLIN